MRLSVLARLGRLRIRGLLELREAPSGLAGCRPPVHACHAAMSSSSSCCGERAAGTRPAAQRRVPRDREAPWQERSRRRLSPRTHLRHALAFIHGGLDGRAASWSFRLSRLRARGRPFARRRRSMSVPWSAWKLDQVLAPLGTPRSASKEAARASATARSSWRPRSWSIRKTPGRRFLEAHVAKLVEQFGVVGERE